MCKGAHELVLRRRVCRQRVHLSAAPAGFHGRKQRAAARQPQSTLALVLESEGAPVEGEVVFQGSS